MREKILPTRRDFMKSTALSGAGTLLALGLPIQAVAAESKPALDLNKDSDLLRAMVKMRCSLGPEMTVGWLRGRRFAFSEGRVEPLCGMVAAVFSKLHRVSEDEFEFIFLEISCYTDFETGALLDTVIMPFSGKEVKVPVHRFGPVPVRLAVNLDEVEHYTPEAGTNQAEFATAGSVAMSKSIARPYLRDGNLFLQHEEYGRRYPENSDRPSLFYKESTTWSAPTRAVLDPALDSIDSHVSYSAMTSWRPWMEMGDIPGNTFSSGFGQRARTPADLPEDYRSFLKREHPDALAEPEAILDSFRA